MIIEAKTVIKKVASKAPTRDDASLLEPLGGESTILISAHCDDAFPFESHWAWSIPWSPGLAPALERSTGTVTFFPPPSPPASTKMGSLCNKKKKFEI